MGELYTEVNVLFQFKCSYNNSNDSLYLKKKVKVNNSFYDSFGLSVLACLHKDHYHLVQIDKWGIPRASSVISTYLAEKGSEAKFAAIFYKEGDFPGFSGEYRGKEIHFMMDKDEFEKIKSKGTGHEFLYKFKKGEIYWGHLDRNMKVQRIKPITLIEL